MKGKLSIILGWLAILFLVVSLMPVSGMPANTAIAEPGLTKSTNVTTTSVDDKVGSEEIEEAARGHPKVEYSLNRLLEAYDGGGLGEAQAFATMHMMVLDDNRVQVVMETTQGAISDLKEAVEAIGGEYQCHYETLLQALVPIDALQSLAERPDVHVIREPRRPIPVAPLRAGTVDTEALGPSNASAWHAEGYTGSGVRVAVIDAGFTEYASLLGTDLPASVTTYDWTSSGMGGSEHGTACAEVVYDMAYGVTMDLHKIGTKVELGNAVNQAIADGADIISMSLIWRLDGPGDGTGYLADIVNNARSNGIFYATGAGNNAEHCWSGQYVDHPSAPGSHEWSPGHSNVNWFGPGDGTAYIIPDGSPIQVVLHWDDWTAVDQDYDMELYYWDGDSWEFVTGSYNDQAGSYPTPEESIGVYASVTAPYGVVVKRFSSTRDVCLRLNASHSGYPLDQRVPERSLMFPADSPDAITVGAVDVSSYNLEPYSSQGPTLGPGGTCSGGETKPDISAYAGVSTVSYGPEGFGGTSAATPHVAGAAALVAEAYPSYTPAQIQAFLEGRAVDLGDPGKDNMYGSGRIHLDSPPGGEPDILVTPPLEPFEVTLPEDTIQNYTLTIGNDGDADLAYTISDRTTGGGSPGGTENLVLEPASQLLEIPLAGDVVEPEEAGASGWQNIMTEDFEGTFPTGSWEASDIDGAVNGEFYWDDDDYKPHWGSRSAWCANGGANGLDPEFYYYPNDMKSWMTYGPFSLADATDAELNFYFWLRSQKYHDYFQWLASTNGSNFYGWQASGVFSGWQYGSFDLTNVPTLGNLCGQTQVWIAFVFQSDYAISDDGAFVDDIELRKYVGGVLPHIDSLSPTQGPEDTRVEINGSNFGTTQGTSTATFNGVSAGVSSWGDTQIVGWVPHGATTGNVVVHTTAGDSNGVLFSVVPSVVGYWAVIVGIADYPGTVNDLDYCDDDAWDVRNALLAGTNWEESHITMLLDSDASKTNIHTAITDMGSSGDGNDVFFFYFSGHGGNAADQPPYDEADGLDEYLAQYDAETDPIWDDEFGEWLASLPGRKVAVALDTCHSGGQVKNSGGGIVRSLSAEGVSAKGDGFVKDIDDIIGGVALAAAAEDEGSWEWPALENGLFTYYFVEGLGGPADYNSDGKISMEESFDYLYPLVVVYPVPEPQHPQIYDGYPDELVILLSELSNPPNTPSNPSPPDHATAVSINADLSWTGGDPDPGDTVTYDVYFDTTGATTLVSNDQSGTTYDPGTLSNNTKYYWKIEATDNHGASTCGPVWEFTTAEGGEDCPWLDENPKAGTVEPGGSDNITVSINTTGLGSDYTAEIVIASNDPDEDPKIVPVTLHVGAQAPTVTTNAATNVENTTATLNGDITDTGGENCDYRGFVWGDESHSNPGNTAPPSSDYDTDWSESGSYGTGTFNHGISSLSEGTKYYYRACARNSAGWSYGSEQSFLTKPDAPSTFDATTAGSTQIDLSWTKGDGAEKTKIQRKQGGYPTNRNDGTQVYFDTGTSTSDTGLSPSTTYYYRAWSYVSGSEQWSDECAEDSATTTEAGITGVLYLDPSGSSASYCHSAQVEIRVNTEDDGIEINGGSINLTYDAECANVTDVAFDDIWDVTAWDSDTSGQETLGFLIPAENLQPGDYPVATLTIHCVNDSIEGCQTDLVFAQGTMLTNMAGQEICPAVEDGTFTCIPCTCGDTNCDADHKVNIADASLLFSHVILPDYPICCAGCDEWCGNVNCLGGVNIADASLLFSHVILGSVQYPIECCQPTQALLKPSSEVEQVLLSLDPGDSSAPPCNTTEVEIWVNTGDDGIEINGGSINLTYDAECANVTDVAFDDMWDVTAWDSHTPGQETLGFLIVAENLDPGDYPVATFTIHCVNYSIEGCQTDLVFAEGTMLTNMAGQEIHPEVEDGTFQCCTPDNPPNMPSNPSPANHATSVSINADLSWSGGDPDPGDTVTYDVYFDTTGATTVVSNDQPGTTYDPGTLSYNTTYYWKIVATDKHPASTTGPVWDFTTRGDIAYLDLVEGCNIISYPGVTAALGEALTNIGPGGLDVALIIWARAAWTEGQWWLYNVAQGHALPSKFTHLEEGRAYLIVVSEDCIWELL